MQADGAQDEGQDGRQARQARADDADVDLDGGPQRGQRVALARVAAADGAVEAVERPEADDGDDAAAFFCCIVSVSFEVWEGRCMCVCVCGTYKPPMEKMSMTPIFLVRETLSVQRAGTGRRMMARSVTMFRLAAT